MRLPVHTPADVDRYVAKAVHHLTAYDNGSVQQALLLSNVAADFKGVQIDSALYLEASGRTASLLPTDFAVQRLYATQIPGVDSGQCTPDNEEHALDQGVNIVVHSGHAGPDDLTTEQDGSQDFTGERAAALTNFNLPIFLSCGCQAGDYSTAGNAGEALMNAAAGGAIAYMGNAPNGLGLAGGMQMIDEWLRYVQSQEIDPLIGDAYLTAHQNLPENDTFTILFIPIPVVDPSSYRWTQKGVVFFGDPLLPVWKTGRPFGPKVQVTKQTTCGATTLHVTLDQAASGTVRLIADGNLYEVPVSGQNAVDVVVAKEPSQLAVGFASPTTYDSFAEVSF
jgi:hypothetical protein